MPFTFPRSLRLTGARSFRAVYDARVCRRGGPLVVYAIPNELGHPRVGFALPRRVGTAVARNRIRRRLREAFRHMQHDLPCSYDVVINVGPHEPLMLAEYQRLLSQSLRALHRTWSKSSERERPTRDKPTRDKPTDA